ncbi:four-helix bundle copper-binding protein, partial [Bacillus sp. NTK034]
GNECKKHQHEHCQKCADACFKCADDCRQMVQ